MRTEKPITEAEKSTIEYPSSNRAALGRGRCFSTSKKDQSTPIAPPKIISGKSDRRIGC